MYINRPTFIKWQPIWFQQHFSFIFGGINPVCHKCKRLEALLCGSDKKATLSLAISFRSCSLQLTTWSVQILWGVSCSCHMRLESKLKVKQSVKRQNENALLKITTGIGTNCQLWCGTQTVTGLLIVLTFKHSSRYYHKSEIHNRGTCAPKCSNLVLKSFKSLQFSDGDNR